MYKQMSKIHNVKSRNINLKKRILKRTAHQAYTLNNKTHWNKFCFLTLIAVSYPRQNIYQRKYQKVLNITKL